MALVTLRRLGGLEHWFWLMNRHRPIHFVVAAEIAGRTTPAMWRAALDAVQDRHPLLSVCIQAGEDAVPFFRRDAEARIPLRVIPRETPLQWQEELARELATPIDSDTAPLVRALVVDGDDRCELLLAMHHAIGDGMSAAFLIRDLLEALLGKVPSALPPPVAQDTLFAPIAKNIAMPNAPPLGRTVTYRPASGPLQVSGVRFSKCETSGLLERARRENTTVHAALAVALVLAGRRISGEWQAMDVRVFTPVNIRKLLNVDGDCVLTLSAGVAPFGPDAPIGFWELVRATKRWVAASQTPEGVMLTLGAIDFSVSNNADTATVAAFSAQVLGYELMLTNLGRVPVESRFGHLELQAVWGPAILVGYEGEQSVGVATTEGSLCLLHSSHKPIGGLLETSKELLLAACAAA